MKALTTAIIPFVLAMPVLANADQAQERNDETGTPYQTMQSSQNTEPAPDVTQNCYSARNCTGRVLSHRDRHNCKVKSRGHSWRDTQGQCFNI